MKIKQEKSIITTELAISHLLRIGVYLCASIVFVGLFARLFHLGHVQEASSSLVAELLSGDPLTTFHPVHGISAIWNGMLAFQADTIIAAGLILLISLPVLRVGLTILVFLRERDWTFFFITLTVFSVLLFSIFLGKAL